MSVKSNISHLLTGALLGVIFAVLSVFTPFATPALATRADDFTVINQDSPENNTAENATDQTTSTDQSTPEDTAAPEAEPEADPATPTEGNNCTNQTGAVGWLICPLTKLVADATDSLYSIIENFLAIEPISFNTNSPIYNIWDYCRGITNIIFVIIILIVVFSQVTGFGFSNYNVKKTLPRIIVSAILINLSFIICSFAVDLSNVIGGNLNSFFNGITESTIASTGFTAESYSIGNVAAGIIATGTLAAIPVTVVAAGGLAAAFWMLLPVLLGAAVSVISGLLTISARQAVVVLLVMIAPLAIIASTLPNTEKWFSKWKSTLLQMLTFYPIFGVLFGASRLVGIIFITSATNVYGVILGIAVQIFPLFFSWQLMKMSGSILGSINHALNNLGQRGVNASRGWAASHQAASRAHHIANSRLPSARLNQYLENRKARRNADLAANQAAINNRSDRYAANVYNRRGQLTRRGERLYNLNAENLNNVAETKRLRAELNEAGFRTDGTDSRIRSGAQQKRVAETNKRLIQGVDLNHASDSFLESAKTANSASYADRVEATRKKIIQIRNDDSLSEEEKMRQISAVDPTITSTLSNISDPKARTQYMNNIFANAISAQAKADKVTRDNYAQLFAATQLTRNIHAEFNKSFADKNYNAMEAAIDELAKRGDFDLIRESLLAHTKEITGEENIEMQKHLADTLIKYKADSAPLWAYAKATNIRRAKHAVHPESIALFTTFEEFEKGIVPEGYTSEKDDTTRELSMSFLVNTINDPSIAIKQDRTTFKYLLEAQQTGNLDARDMGFAIKQLRSAASSGQIDGEQLANLNKLVTGGVVVDSRGDIDLSRMKPSTIDYIQSNAAQIRSNILNYIENMSAGQLAGMKESTFLSFNAALTYLDQILHTEGVTISDYSNTGDGRRLLSSTFRDAMYANAANNMNNILKSNMNTNIKNWLGIPNNK